MDDGLKRVEYVVNITYKTCERTLKFCAETRKMIKLNQEKIKNERCIND